MKLYGRRLAEIVCALWVGGLLVAHTLGAQTYEVLHAVEQPPASTSPPPYGGLVEDSAGTLYGTTAYGGPSGLGTVFRLDASGSLTTLYNFSGPDGANPYAGLILDGSGNLYGTTSKGGSSNFGTVFKIASSGSLTTLHSFNGGDGAFPYAALVSDSSGILYGTTIRGGSNSYGTIFKLEPSGNLTTLHSFVSNGEGAYPYAALILDDSGNLFGTTKEGGNAGWGTVFKLDPQGNLTTLYDFPTGNFYAYGAAPYAALTRDESGNLFGTTSEGGTGGTGSIFRIDPSGNATNLYEFYAEGFTVFSSLILDATGNLYGTTFNDVWTGNGTVFKFDTAGNFTTLHEFNGSDGALPHALIFDCSGNLYGTTLVGGQGNGGVVFRLTLPSPPLMVLVPTISQSPNPDGSVTLTSSGAHSYQWSTGATTQSITVSTSGSYQVTVTNAAGCMATSAVANVSVTQTGSGVSVTDGGVTATFSTVSTSGFTTAIPIDPSAAGSVPAGGYSLSALGIAYNISTTATISGDIIIAFVVPTSVDEVTFNSLRILHGEGGSLVDRTYFSADGCSPVPTSPCPAPNFSTRTIYAQVSSLSPFVLATNGKPVIQYITAPSAPVAVSSLVGVQARFTDPGTHTAVWSWDDGTTSTGVVTEAGGIGTVTGSHAYTAAGVYQATLTVTDGTGLSGQKISPYIVIYDPNGGFVTGGGQFSSPAGAYVAQPALIGTASFGFVAKYPRSGNVPSGEIEFHVADLNLHSTSYDWLVITSPRGQYQGSGTVNGSGNYGFIVTLIDGQASGGGGVDKIRIKIWDKNNGNAIIYDNQMGAPDNANPATAIGGGSIVLHR